jgi:hypothetical protein
MAQAKTKEAASTKPEVKKPTLAVAKSVPAAPAPKKPEPKSKVEKTIEKTKGAPPKEAKTGSTKERGAGDLAGKKIFLNMANDKVASAEGNNPKRGKCREWFSWYIKGGALKGGCPVEEYFKLGGKSGYVRWDLAHGLITVK